MISSRTGHVKSMSGSIGWAVSSGSKAHCARSSFEPSMSAWTTPLSWLTSLAGARPVRRRVPGPATHPAALFGHHAPQSPLPSRHRLAVSPLMIGPGSAGIVASRLIGVCIWQLRVTMTN